MSKINEKINFFEKKSREFDIDIKKDSKNKRFELDKKQSNRNEKILQSDKKKEILNNDIENKSNYNPDKLKSKNVKEFKNEQNYMKEKNNNNFINQKNQINKNYYERNNNNNKISRENNNNSNRKERYLNKNEQIINPQKREINKNIFESNDRNKKELDKNKIEKEQINENVFNKRRLNTRDSNKKNNLNNDFKNKDVKDYNKREINNNNSKKNIKSNNEEKQIHKINMEEYYKKLKDNNPRVTIVKKSEESEKISPNKKIEYIKSNYIKNIQPKSLLKPNYTTVENEPNAEIKSSRQNYNIKIRLQHAKNKINAQLNENNNLDKNLKERKNSLNQVEEIKKEDEKKKKTEELKKLADKRKKINDSRKIYYEKKLQNSEEKRKIEEKNRFKNEFLKKIGKTEKDFTKEQLNLLLLQEKLKNDPEDYKNRKNCKYIHGYLDEEGRNLKGNFQLKLEINNELQIHDMIILHNGKLVTLNSQNTSILKFYNEKNYQLEHTVIIENKINYINEINNKLYCCLDINSENICVLSTDEYYETLYYLNEHFNPVTSIIQTFKGYLISSDKSGEILVWNDDEKLKKRFNVFNANISNIYELNEKEQQIAVFSYDRKALKFIDLRYEDIFVLETIENIYGSGIKNNMVKLNEYNLAIVGTYIYIINIPILSLTNIIYTYYSNFLICDYKLKYNKNIYFIISQSLANNIDEEQDKGTLGLYKYTINDELLSEQNELDKIISQEKCHTQFIISVLQIDENNIVTGCSDGTFKIWKVKL